MKALTNILNYILLLLMILIASCTEDTAEVDNLVRGEEYVTVRMQVPGMKNATTRADEAEDNLTSVWALVFRDSKLVSKTEVTTESTLIPSTSTTGTFNLSRPKVNDVIHFLGNVPNGVTLPDVGDDESALCNLETGDRENLSYWGKATYTGTDITVNLYRHLAKIEIAPDPNECTFPEDQLFIVGLVNANQVGALVPCNEEGTFGYRDEPTLPESPSSKTDENAQPLVTSLYVFEHDNPDAYTEANKDNFFCVICQIGKDYYKVALTSDGETPYDIIRNHRYVIYVKDLDEGAADYPTALTSDPINLEVKVEKEVALQLIQEGIDENGDELKIQQGDIDINSHANSTEEVTIKVVVPAGVKTLTVQAEGFTVTSGDAGDGREMTSDGNNQYTIKEAYRNQENIVRFKLKLNNDVDAETATTITVSGEGEDQYTTVTANASTTITVTPAGETEGTIWWQGLMILDAMDEETKIAFPKSYFFNGETPLIPVGSQIVFDFENVTGFLSDTDDDYLRIWMQAADPRDWSQVASQDFVYDGNRATLNVTQEVLDDILDTSDGEYANDNALIIQGQGRILKKITLIRAKESIDAEPDKTQLYYDSDEPQVVTVNVTVPDGVERLNIGGAENFAIAKTAGNGTLNETETETTYTMDSERTATFTFTLNAQNVTSPQTITFSDPSESVNGDEVQITMAATPTVEFSPDEISKEMSINDTYTITMKVPYSGTLTALSIDAEGFTVTASTEGLSGSDGSYTYTGGTTQFTFTLTSADTDSRTIHFYNGQGVDINVPEKVISVTVKAAAVTNMSVVAVNGDSTIDIDSGDTNVTFTLTKPASVQGVSVNITDSNGASANDLFNLGVSGNNTQYQDGNTVYDNGSNENIQITLTAKDVNTITAGEYTVTFMNNDDQSMTATTTITVNKTGSSVEAPEGAIWNKVFTPSISLNYGTPNKVTLSVDDDLKWFVEGNTFGVELSMSGGEYNGSQQLYIQEYGDNYNSNNLPSASGNVLNANITTNVEFVLTDTDIQAIKNGSGLSFWGGGVTVTQIYIKESSTL